MILPDDILFDLSQQYLIGSYLTGKAIEMPSLSESEKAFWREGTSCNRSCRRRNCDGRKLCDSGNAGGMPQDSGRT